MDDVDPQTEAGPLALQFAVRVDKASPPTVPAICAATVRATIALLDDPRSASGGEWHAAVAAWNGARIRKIVRRARGAAWTRAGEVDGVTASADGAEVRAFVPGPMHRVPPAVAKLQIQSSPLAEPELHVGHTPGSPGSMCLAITPRFAMSWGKQAAQFAHCGQRLWERADPAVRQRWNDAGQPIEIRFVDETGWAASVDWADEHIHDGGFTEIPPGTHTTCGWFAVE